MSSKESSTLAGWPLGIVAVLIVFLCAIYFTRQWLQPPTQPDPDVGRAAVEAFLGQISAGKPAEAWNMSSAEFKSIAGRESFVRLVQKTPLLKEPLQFNSVQTVMVQEQPRTEFLFQSTKSGGSVRLLLGYEGGQWKVDRLTL